MSLASVYVKHLAVANVYLTNRVRATETFYTEGFIPLHISHGGHHTSSSSLGQMFQIFAVATPTENDTSLDKYFMHKS